MSILQRLQRIAKANINWLMDKAEPPEAEVKARIAELETAIRDGKAAAATYGATFRKLEKEVDELKAKQTDFLNSASRAVKAGDDKLARKFLTEKVHLEERITNLTPGLEQGRQTCSYLRDNLDKLSDELRKAKLKLEELRSRKLAADARQVFSQSLDTVTSATENGAMFERMENGVIESEARADISEELAGDFDLEAKSRELQIESELDALKQQMTDSPAEADA